MINIKNCVSEPQPKLFNLVKSYFEGVVLEYPLSCKKDGIRCFLDIAIPNLKINVEYDGQHHFTLGYPLQNVDDEIRDEKLKSLGWTVLRFNKFNIFQAEEIIKQLKNKLK